MRVHALEVPVELLVRLCLHLRAVLGVLGRQHLQLLLGGHLVPGLHLRSSPLRRLHLLVEVEVALHHLVPQRGRCLRLLHLQTWLGAAHQVRSHNTLWTG